MRDRPSIDRRTVLRTIGAGTAASITLAGTASANESPPPKASNLSKNDARGDSCDCESRPAVPEAVANRPETYIATVDRIVDGTHVVVLLEADGRTVDQIVVSAAEYPCLEERDKLVVTVEGDDLVRVRRLRE